MHHALGRARTRLPADAWDGPISKVTQTGKLSRLRKYRVGNCTFVTFGREGNQAGVSPRNDECSILAHTSEYRWYTNIVYTIFV
jgi:hypothetical protein